MLLSSYFSKLNVIGALMQGINTFDGGWDSPAAQIQEAPTAEEDSDLRRKSFVGGV